MDIMSDIYFTADERQKLMSEYAYKANKIYDAFKDMQLYLMKLDGTKSDLHHQLIMDFNEKFKHDDFPFNWHEITKASARASSEIDRDRMRYGEECYKNEFDLFNEIFMWLTNQDIDEINIEYCRPQYDIRFNIENYEFLIMNTPDMEVALFMGDKKLIVTRDTTQIINQLSLIGKLIWKK